MLAKLRFKYVSRGVYELIDYEGILTKSELNKEYLAAFPYFYLDCTDIVISDKNIANIILCLPCKTRDSVYMQRNFLIAKTELTKLIAIMNRAGQRLTDINKQSKEITVTI